MTTNTNAPKRVREANRVSIQKDINAALDKYVNDATVSIAGIPGAKVDKNSIVTGMVKDALATLGYLPLKKVP